MPHRFVPFRLTVCGLDELAGHRADGVSHVLSILDPNHPEPEIFQDFAAHARLELRFHDIIDERPGWRPPELEHVARILAFGRDLRTAPGGCAHLLVHCHAGVSRSTAALTMLLAQEAPERPAAEAIAAVAVLRAKAWPNLRMIEFADLALGRKGELVTAARGRYRDLLAQRPELGPFMAGEGRGRELEGLLA